MREPEVKPCPFCGGKADVIENTGRPKRERQRFHVCCSQCTIGQFVWNDDREKAISAWNTRHEVKP